MQSPTSITSSLLSPPCPHGRAFMQPSLSTMSPLTYLSCPQGRATTSTLSALGTGLMCGKTSFWSGFVLGGCCCPQPTWPEGLQPSGAAPFLPHLLVPNIALTHRIVKAAPRDGMAGAAGLRQLPRELRHLTRSSGETGSVPLPRLRGELVGIGTGVFNVLQTCFTGKPRGSSPGAAWFVMGAIGDGVLGQRCKSGTVQEYLVPSHL